MQKAENFGGGGWGGGGEGKKVAPAPHWPRGVGGGGGRPLGVFLVQEMGPLPEPLGENSEEEGGPLIFGNSEWHPREPPRAD